MNCEQNSLLYLVRMMGGGVCHTRDADGQTRKTCYYRSLKNGKLNFLEGQPPAWTHTSERTILNTPENATVAGRRYIKTNSGSGRRLTLQKLDVQALFRRFGLIGFGNDAGDGRKFVAAGEVDELDALRVAASLADVLHGRAEPFGLAGSGA